MGYRQAKIDFYCDKDEQVETNFILKRERHCAVHGVVYNEKGCPLAHAVVKLFVMPDKHEGYELIPLAHTFTDACGQFMFGPLIPGKRYVLKAWYNCSLVKCANEHHKCMCSSCESCSQSKSSCRYEISPDLS